MTAAEARTSVQVKEKTTNDQDYLVNYLEKNGLEYIDDRAEGGSIWVIGDRGIESLLKPLENFGIRFRFKVTGGKASRNRPAWFWYES